MNFNADILEKMHPMLEHFFFQGSLHFFVFGISVSRNYVALTGDIGEIFGLFHLPSRTFSKFVRLGEDLDISGMVFTADEKMLIVARSLVDVDFMFYNVKTLQKVRTITG